MDLSGVQAMSEPRPRYGSTLERTLETHLIASGAPPWEVEFHFARPRRWRFDFAWPDLMIAVECEGGTYSQGRHVRGSGFAADCEKYNAAALLGWCVLRYPGKAIRSGAAVDEIVKAIEKAKG